MRASIRYTRVFTLSVCLVSCGFRHQKGFRVVPGNPAYLLRSPDSREVPLPDVLRDYNGFEAGKGWIDLRPRMELRVENAYYEQGSSRRGLQGFLGTEIARYRVLQKGLQLLSFQPMEKRPTADTPVQKLIAPEIEHARQYRLYYEIVFNAAKNEHGSVLLGGDSDEQIANLAKKLTDPQAWCENHPAHCAAFPEACSVSVELDVSVNGKNTAVVWGSLLSSLTGDSPRTVELKRLYGARLVPVRLDARDGASLRIPLLPGDQISWK